MQENTKNETLYGTKLGGYAFSVMFICYVIITFTLGVILDFAKVDREGVLFNAIGSTFSIISMILVVIFINKRRHEKILLTVYVKKFNFLYIAVAVVLSVGMFLGFGFVNESIGTALEKAGVDLSGINLPINGVWTLILFIILYGIFPAIEEECFFRGLLLESVGESGKPILSALTVALCFSLYHGSVVQLIYQFIYGFLLCLLSIKAKSVVPCIISHFINNFAIMLFSYLNVEINLYNPLIITGGILLVLLFVVFVLFYKDKKEKENAESISEDVGSQKKTLISRIFLKTDVAKNGDSNFKDFYKIASFGIVLCLIIIISGVIPSC